MNERMTALAVQAFRYANQNSRDGDDSTHGCLYREKFAELIVKECAQVANDSNQLKNRAPGVSVGDVVRKHFGVDNDPT